MATTLTISILADVAKAVQGIDSIDKRTQSFGDNMKSAALAIGSAFSTQKILGWAESWVSAGFDANRAIKDVQVTFGQAAAGVEAWGETASSTFGTTAADAEKMAAKVGIALEGYGFSQTDAAKASELLVQRSADMAKVLGVDQESVLAKVETAMRGRTAGLKDYGVEVEKGASQTDIFNAFMQDTAKYAGQADTPMATFHATLGDMSAQLGQALIPAISAVLPLLQGLGDWAKNNKTLFDAIVITLTALALVFGLAATAAGIFAVASLAALWPILLVVAGVAALIAVVILVIKYWGDLSGALSDAWNWIVAVTDKLGPLALILGGPIAAAILIVQHFGQAWDAVQTAVSKVYDAIKKVVDFVNSAANAVGGFLSKIPGVGSILSAPAPAPGAPGAYGPSAYAAPVTFAPSITFTGDVGDPTLAGRRIVAALETWVEGNGRRRLAALIAP